MKKHYYMDLKSIQNVELEILKMFDKLCKKYGLYYSIAYGTIIGAIRHKGFIPWDDDVDVMMPRSDYEKLIRIFQKEKDNLAKDYVLLHGGIKGYNYPFYKICDNRTVAKAEDNLTKHGIWIDIFPVDSVYEDEQKNERLHKRFILLRSIVLSYTTDFSASHKNWKFIIKFVFSIYAKIYGIERLLNKINNLAVEKRSNNMMSVLTWQTSVHGNISKEAFFNSINVDFEGIKVPVISCYDSYLKGIYGDYMQLPPENKRKTHMLKAYYK